MTAGSLPDLQDAQTVLDAVLATTREGVLVMDRDGVFRDCNAQAASILGRDVEAIVGSTFRDDLWRSIRADGTPLAPGAFPAWQACYSGEPVDDRLIGIYPADGPPRWVRMSARPLTRSDAEPPHAAVATFEDVTNQRQQTKALEASRGLLARVLANSQDGIMVLDAVRDADGTVADFEWLLVNPRAEELLGRDVEDLVGCRLLDVIPESATSGLFDDYVAVVETGDPIEREVRYEQGDADAWFHVVAFRVEDGFAATFRDVTEQRRAAQAMAATNEKLEQRNRTLRDFAYIASHDLQEPLRKISSFSDLMMEDYGDAVDETGAYYLDRMQDAAQRMSQLISDLLVYSRVMTRARPFEPVDLGRLAEQVVSDLSLQIEEVDGSVHVGDLPTIEGDGTQLRQLLQNLVGNGLKFHRPDTPPEVTVSARTEREDEGPDTCTLVVEDNGIGFEQKYADRIFTPFKRLHGRDEFPGTGMGLAICRRIVERHNGRIDVVSTPGEGTRFAVVLPMQQDADPVYAGEAETDKGAGSPDPVSSRPSPATTD